MKKKNIIIFAIIILLLMFSLWCIFNLENNNIHHEINNNSYNNTENIEINNTTGKNSDENSTIGNFNLNDNYNSQKVSNGNNNGKSSHYSDDALLAKKMVEKNSLGKNKIAGYPVYKDMGCWLVPIFDKNTGKFIGSIYTDSEGSIFLMGPNTHSEYKKLIHGKTSQKSDSNKHVKKDKSNSNKKDKSTLNRKDKSSSNVSNDKQKETDVIGQKMDIIGKYNPDISINLDYINDNSSDA